MLDEAKCPSPPPQIAGLVTFTAATKYFTKVNSSRMQAVVTRKSWGRMHGVAGHRELAIRSTKR